jgi:hypothetical protein
VYDSSSGTTTLVNFGAGSKDVFVTQPAEQAIYQETDGNLKLVGGVIGLTIDGTEGTTLPNTTFQAFATIDGYIQSNQQNLSDGPEASSDFVATADNGSDTENYMDMGMASSNYSFADFSAFKPNTGYVVSTGSDLRLISGKYGAAVPGAQDIVLVAGSLKDTEERVRVYGLTGNMRIDAATNPADSGEKLQVIGSAKITGAAAFGSTVLLNADPTLALQAATKAYVDGQVAQGFTVHTPVKAVANTFTGSGTTYNNGAGTITNNTNAAFGVVDGVTINVGDRVLFRALTNSYENGVYTLTDAGSGATPWIVTRATDFDTVGPGEIANNAYFFVSQGTTYKGYAYVLSQLTSPIVLGTTPLPFTEFAASTVYTGGTNITVTGQTIDLTGTVAATNGGTGTNTVATGDLLYGSAADTWGKLTVGSAYKSLVMNGAGTLPEWNAVALNQSGAVSGALPATNGGTGQSSYTLGDVLYSSATNTLSKLAGNTTTTKKFLTQTGTGSASAAPTWEQVSLSDISGLGTMSGQNSNAVAITGGTLAGVAISGSSTIDASAIGGTTPAAVRGITMEASNGIMANATTVTSNYSLPSNYNALSAGPISVASGVAVTIPTGSVWTVV